MLNEPNLPYYCADFHPSVALTCPSALSVSPSTMLDYPGSLLCNCNLYFCVAKIVNCNVRIKDPPLDFCTVIVHKIILSKSTARMGSISDKELSVPRGDFSNYFMTMILFSQSYCSKSETLEITYDMKNLFLVLYFLISLQTTEYKNNLYVHLYIIWSNP